MKERVVSLSDRGRALEWLSLGFGLWLVAGLVFALLLADAVTAPVAIASAAAHLVAGAAIAIGAALMLRSDAWLWSTIALAGLAVVLVERALLVWLPFRHLSWSFGAVAQLVMVTSAAYGVRDIAGREGRRLPASLLAAVAGAEVTRFLLLATFGAPHDPLLPWGRAGLIAIATVVSAGLLLLAIREASAVVRAQIWAGEPGVTSPARAADWQRSAGGLDRFGAFLIGKIAIAAAAMPLLVIGVLTGTHEVLADLLIPGASALCSAGMLAGLVACRRVPDPPDARAGFTGAALVVAACLVGELYALSVGSEQALVAAISSLGHLVAYLALLRSVARIGERLGDDDLIRRAGALGRLAVVIVPASASSGYLLLGNPTEPAGWIVVPIAVAAVAFAALLPCALLSRDLGRVLRGRFAEPPRAVARTERSPR